MDAFLIHSNVHQGLLPKKPKLIQEISGGRALKIREPTIMIDKLQFSQTLKAAIKERGLSYQQATDLVCDKLPEGLSLSAVSLWNYANGKALPRRIEVLEALRGEFHIESVNRGSENARETAIDEARQTISESEDSREFLLKASGSGLAFIRFAAELEWDKAIKIVQILRRDVSESPMAPP
jgi:transcriptional regulator with XRE-family HTH domain